MMKHDSVVGAVILNYNGWEHTLACLGSMLGGIPAPSCIIVVDNGSTDDSVDMIESWAQGDQSPNLLLHPVVAQFVVGLGTGTVPFVRLDAAAVEGWELPGPDKTPPRLVLLENGGNRGYAGGVNLGIRLLMQAVSPDYVWVSNNDVIVAPDALAHMLERCGDKSDAGLCGASLLDARQPDRVQCLGGRYSKWLGLTRHVGAGIAAAAAMDMPPADVEREVNYIVGASMLASRDWLHEVGLMDEDYFLYYEDVDWSLRGRGKFSLAVAPRARVWHFEGATTGGGQPDAKSPLADICSLRSRVACTVKNYPCLLPFVLLGLCGSIMRRLVRKQWGRVGLVLRAVAGGLTGRFPREIAEVRFFREPK